MEIVNDTAAMTAQEGEEEKQGDTRKSFIDAKYERFKEFGKRF